MKIEFIKNIQFTKLIKVDGQLREFNFRKVNAKNESKFTVDVSDDRGRRIIFTMIKDDGSWKIVSPDDLPPSVAKNEPILHDIIEEELKTGGSAT